MLGVSWQKLFRLPQTYFLLVGAILGYATFLVWVGIRTVPLVVGGIITVTMLLAWVWQVKQISSQKAVNLLNINNFIEQIEKIEQKIAKKSVSEWQNTRKWAIESQTFAQNITNKESVLLPELIETLHTVLDLSNQVAEAIVAREQVQTNTYRLLTQQHLDTCCTRLQQTHEQLQQLQDQVLLSSLDMSIVKTGLPNHLRGLIAENRTALHTIIQDLSVEEGG